MVFFHRLRLRWRERRLERKLREAGVAPTRRSAAASKELFAHGVPIQRLRGNRKALQAKRVDTNASPTTTLDERDLSPTTRKLFDNNNSGSYAPLEEALIEFVQQYTHRRRQEFPDELASLRALQLLVPSIRHGVDRWAHRHHESVHIRVRTERELARWKRTHESMREELVRIRDLVMCATRLELVDRVRPTDPTDPTDGLVPSTPPVLTLVKKPAGVILPHPGVWLAMVVAALLAGVYGLLALGVVLKLARKI